MCGGGGNEKEVPIFFFQTSPPSVGELKCLTGKSAYAVSCVTLGVLSKKLSASGKWNFGRTRK